MRRPTPHIVYRSYYPTPGLVSGTDDLVAAAALLNGHHVEMARANQPLTPEPGAAFDPWRSKAT